MTNAWDPSPGASHLALAQPASSSARIVIHNQIRPLASPLRVSPSRTRDRLSLETHHHPSRTVSLPLHSPHIFHHLPQSFFMWLFAKWHSDSKVYSCSHDTNAIKGMLLLLLNPRSTFQNNLGCQPLPGREYCTQVRRYWSLIWPWRGAGGALSPVDSMPQSIFHSCHPRNQLGRRKETWGYNGTETEIWTLPLPLTSYPDTWTNIWSSDHWSLLRASPWGGQIVYRRTHKLFGWAFLTR